MSQDEYFSVNVQLRINAKLLDHEHPLPSEDDFENEIPASFRLAAQFSKMDSTLEEGVGTRIEDAVSRHINLQNEKINLLLGFMLSQQDEPKQRFMTESFGASRLVFTSDEKWDKDAHVRLKIFIDNPPSAVYCYGAVESCEEKSGQYEIAVEYTHLLEEDRDVLIRAALFEQQKMLRQRALDRNN
ncbi:PilZ domain-containing protein [Veronia nyctiphanis]|uniref:PilZ domain-containing protein n=1 Tax=Veronia nyctiphanis TaxID=1278244 RepID=A0A4Q0YNA5_9GAMM|nr:PilZ domain-containing protein [Veronia nyctiphanis]RXJ72422.1 PilZ domain-containing protein [Veronia nyctiphanis]